ncbi:MAG: hypothetical protein E7609_00165 [Ruminococcaceae bacterium]|nr:hypothetical protein [Oscillospiraceae bacterium]
MNTNETSTPEKRMRERREHPVLCMQREDGSAVFRYVVSITDAEPHRYSVYAEYRDAERHTVGEVPDFSEDRDTAESFCSMLERFGITPLSLHAVYEDIYTP